MPRSPLHALRWPLVTPALVALVLLIALGRAANAASAPPREGDYVVRDFHFVSGETLPELRLHYLTLGEPKRDARGRIDNAVLILHGTGGTGRQFLSPVFANVLYGPGAPLDTTRFWILLPDGIGHGRSSKPSDGLRARFPHYTYDDMVRATHQLLTEHLGVRHLRLVMGTSMGGMHTWVWGETYPDFMDALMPLACQPIAIAGRNRMWRKMAMDAIRKDPAYHDGQYTAEPTCGLRTALDMLLIAGSAPLYFQKAYGTRDSADAFVDRYERTRLPELDANDLIYQLDASRDYDPSPKLERITAPLLAVNSADDFINPPELGNCEREIRRVEHGRFVLLPITEQTRGHGTHTWAVNWRQYLVEILESPPRPY